MKRLFDFFLALTGLFVSLPLWFIFGLAICCEDRGSIFYLQERVGKEGKIFKSIKFRSMLTEAEKGRGPVQAKANDPRATKTGRILRATALDELPQLINILKGEMSFVGPRALRPEEIENGQTSAKSIFDFPEFKQRSKVRPGLTGAAQVLASRHIAWRGKFKYDLWYIEHMQFCLDIKLLAKSILRTLRAKWDT